MLKTAITALALSTLALSPALAGTKLKGVDLKPTNSAYASGPRIIVERKGGKLAISDALVYVAVRTGGKIDNTSKKYNIFVADVFVQSIWGKGNAYELTPRSLEPGEGVRSINGEKTLYFGKHYLGPLAKEALAACAVHNGPDVKYVPIEFPLTLVVKAGKQSFGGHDDIVTKEASTAIMGDVMCPGKPQRTPVAEETAPPPRAKIPAKVKSAKLAIVNGIGKSCPKPVFLVATFETDRAGSFDVILRRNDGATDRKTVTAVKKGGKFIAKLEKTYNLNKDARRKYMVEVVGQPKASAWVAMTVNCGGPGRNAAKNGLTLN